MKAYYEGFRKFFTFLTAMADVNQLKAVRRKDAVELILILNMSIFVILQVHSTAGQQWM